MTLLPLPAQDRLQDWEEKIETFSANNQADSLNFYFQKKANHYRQTDSLAAWADTYWDWQDALSDDPAKALAMLDTAVQKAWRSPKTTDEAEAMLYVHTTRRHLLFQSGKILAAIKAGEAALALYKNFPIEDFEALDFLYVPMVGYYTRLGDNEKARALCRAAIQNHAAGAQDAALAGLYNNLGLSYWDEGDQKNAIAAYEKGLQCTPVPPIKSGLLLQSLAKSYLASGQTDEAAKSVQAAITTLTKINPRTPEVLDYLSGAWLVKAKLASLGGKSVEALACLRQAMDFAETTRGNMEHRDIVKIHLEFGKLYLKSGETAASVQAFHKALSALIPGLSESDLQALPKPAQLYEENTIYEALEGKADALTAQYEQSKDLKTLRLALDCHQLAAQTEALLRRSLQYESSKITLLSQSRQRVEKAIGIARELYVQSGDDTFLYSAWASAEQAKSTVLLEAVQRNRFDATITAGDTLLRKQRLIRQSLAYFERALLLEPDSPLRIEWLQQRDDLLRELTETERQLQQQHPAWAALRKQTSGLSGTAIRALRDTLPEHAIIEYFVGEQHIEVFGQSPKGEAVWERVALRDSLAAKTQQLLALLQSRQAMEAAGAYRELAHEIYQEALQPALSAFHSEVRNLLIVPDAWLAFLPFEALLHEPSPQTSWETAPFLLRKYGLHYAFSLAVLENQRQLPAKAAQNLLQLAPRFSAGQRALPPLLHSDGEAPIDKICKSHLHLDAQASLEKLKAQAADYRVLHLSTHAGVDTGGLLPRVELYDRAAYLPDIYALQLQADLVVLSACQTSLGQFKKGEGVMSLSRAFTYAGAKGLVSSLWTINEAATAKLFQRMYASLEAGASKPLALRQAKLGYLDDPAVPAFQKSPYYWAGLIYLGDEAAIELNTCPRFSFLYLLALAGLLVLIGMKFWPFFR